MQKRSRKNGGKRKQVKCNHCLCSSCYFLYEGVLCMSHGYEEAWTICNQCKHPTINCEDYVEEYIEEEKEEKIRRKMEWD